MSKLKFYSVVNNDVNSDSGLRTAATLTFLGNGNDSMVKELTQNSIDAKPLGSKEALKIKIEQREILKSDIPDFDEFEKMLGSMRKYWLAKGDQYKKFFDRVDKTLKSPKINMLVFEDFNTSGLQGDDSTHNTFKNCVNDENVSGKKSEFSLGSHGIGKNAVFNYSNISTVFYSSINEAGEYKFKGVSKLGTFSYNKSQRSHRVYYGAKVGEQIKLVDNEKSIPKPFRRKGPGLSQFVLFVEKMDGFIDNIKKSFLETYWFLFEKGQLEVEINGEKLNSENFLSECERLYKGDSSPDNPLQYINVLKTKPHVKKIHKIGEVELYLAEQGSDDENFSNKIMFLRDGMKIKLFPKGVGGLPKPICGLLYCKEDHGNAIMGAMEPHSHHDFFPQLLDDKTVKDANGNHPNSDDGRKILEELKSFIRETVLSIKNKYVTDVTEVPFIDELFSGVIDGVKSGGGVGKTIVSKKETFNRKVNQQDFAVTLSSNKKNTLVFADEDINVGDEDGGTGGGDGGSGGSGRGGKGNNPDTGTGGGKKNKSRRTKSISSRFFFKETKSGNNVYSVILRASSDLDNINLELTQNSDSGLAPSLEGTIVSVSQDGTQMVVKNNIIEGVSVSESNPLHLELEISEKFKSSLAIKIKK
jgi:hypothetical protein